MHAVQALRLQIREESEDKSMIRTTLKIDGMMCGMCEAHVCDAIRKAVPEAKKVTANRGKKEAGVMVAASIWSLIVPAIEQSAEKGRLAFLPAFIGFWLGILFLLLLDHIIPHLHRSIDQADQVEGPKARLDRTIMMVLAVTLHNIPEGMAVGVVYAGLLSGSANITAGGALDVALG